MPVRGWWAVAAFALCAACGGDDGDSRIEIEVAYPSAGAEALTNSVHAWAVASTDDSRGTCSALVSRSISPYADAFDVLADMVYVLPVEGPIVLDAVPSRDVLVYVEAVNFVGTPELAGCVPASLGGGTVPVAITLTSAGTFDCADAQTPPGAPCDDGMLCTVGEVCSGGSCGGGGPRDCNYVADACNGARCDEALGCMAEPVPNLTPCNDGLYCSNGDVCMGGVCAGAARDCSPVEDQCNTSMCNEGFDRCDAVAVPNGTGCDDTLFCTDVDTCNFGFCNGTARDCSTVEDACNASTCNEALDRCDPVPLSGIAYDDMDACTMGTTCSVGVCAGGAVTDADGDGFPAPGCGGGGSEDCNDALAAESPGNTEGPLGDPTCTDGLDNDCDTLIDVLDTDSCI